MKAFQIGDTVTYRNAFGQVMTGTIVGLHGGDLVTVERGGFPRQEAIRLSDYEILEDGSEEDDEDEEDEQTDEAMHAWSELLGPDEDDYTTTDHKHIYGSGRLVVTVPDGVDFGPWLLAWMERDGFCPNVWFISDHGNAHLCDLT